MKIFGITIKSEAEKLIDSIEQAYNDKRNLQIHISRLNNKKCKEYLFGNEKRFDGYVDFKSEYDLMLEKTFEMRLYGCGVTVSNASPSFMEKNQVIFNFENLPE